MTPIGLEEMRELLVGAVDLYVHSSPDVLPRRNDDLALARELREARFGAAVHRHHFCSTVDRSQLVADATGFRLCGAILLNDAVGGLNPRAVEVALRLGGRWIGMPTLGAQAYRHRLDRLPAERRRVIGLGAGHLSAIGPDGEAVPAVEEILALAAASGAVVNLGYLSHTECLAVQRVARRHGGLRMVVTNPTAVMGLGDLEIDELLAAPNTFIELTAYSMFPERVGGADVAPERAVQLFRRVGVGRCVLSSDSGTAGAPSTIDLLAAVGVALSAAGLTRAELAALVRENPAQLVA